jgi:hypothetical protein
VLRAGSIQIFTAVAEMSHDVFSATFASDKHKFPSRHGSRSSRAPEFIYPDHSSSAKVQPLDKTFPTVTRDGMASAGLIVEQDSMSLRMIVTDLTVKGKEMASRVWKGDIVIQIDGQGTSSMSLNDVNKLQAGPIGSCAEIVLLRPIPADDTYSRAQVRQMIVLCR